MQTILKATFFLVLILGTSHTSEAQLLNKLKKKAEKKVERAIDGNQETKKTSPKKDSTTIPIVSSDNNSSSAEDVSTQEDDCEDTASYRKSIELKMQKIDQVINEDQKSLPPSDLKYRLNLAKATRDELVKNYPDCDINDINTRITNAEKSIAKYESLLRPFDDGTFETSSPYYTQVILDNFVSGSVNTTMDIQLKSIDGQVHKGTFNYSSNNAGLSDKIEAKIDDIKGLSLLAYKTNENIYLEFYDFNKFAGIMVIGNTDKSILKKEAEAFNIPDSESNGMYLGEVQKREAGRIVLSKMDNLGHENKGPFNLNEFTIGDKLYSRTFYEEIKPPVEMLQRKGFLTTREGFNVRIVNEIYLDGNLAITSEEGPFHDEEKNMANSWTSSKAPLMTFKRDGLEEKFMDYVLKNNLPSKKYTFEWKRFVRSTDYPKNERVFLASTGPIDFNITDDGLQKLCATDFGPPIAPFNTDSQTKTLLSTLRKHAKANGWTEKFTDKVSNRTSWTKVYDAFNRYTHSKCSAVFRTEYTLEDGRKSYGVISALFYKYPNGSIEVFGMAGQHYIPRVCK